MKSIMATTDVAKLVRITLKKHFPDIKFKVRTERYKSKNYKGSSIVVEWVQGPTEQEVENVAGKYASMNLYNLLTKGECERWLSYYDKNGVKHSFYCENMLIFFGRNTISF